MNKILLVILIIVILGAGGYFVWQYWFQPEKPINLGPLNPPTQYDIKSDNRGDMGVDCDAICGCKKDLERLGKEVKDSFTFDDDGAGHFKLVNFDKFFYWFSPFETFFGHICDSNSIIPHSFPLGGQGLYILEEEHKCLEVVLVVKFYKNTNEGDVSKFLTDHCIGEPYEFPSVEGSIPTYKKGFRTIDQVVNNSLGKGGVEAITKKKSFETKEESFDKSLFVPHGDRIYVISVSATIRGDDGERDISNTDREFRYVEEIFDKVIDNFSFLD